MNAIDQAISICKGLSGLAKELPANPLPVTPQRVSNWRTRGVPTDMCPAIERATKGQVRCEDLRPDVDWGYLRQPSTVNPENGPNLEEAA